VLKALIWPNALLALSLVFASTRGAPIFVLVLLSVLLVLFMLLYGAAYIVFGRIDPNLLRSERYNIERMAIEHGLYGDSNVGLHSSSGLNLPRDGARALPKPATGDDDGG
jgi:hypothetical protein